MKAVGYIRVSTEEQRLSPQAQRADIKDWCVRYGVELVDIGEDIGASGSLEPEDRPGLSDALDALEAHKAQFLVATRRDRIARDHDLVAVINFELRKNGARVISTDRDPHRQEPGMKILDAVQDAVSEMERGLLIARVREAMDVKRQRGERIGSVPYGFRLGDDGKTLRRCDREQRAIQMARRLAAKGASLRKIAHELTRAGHDPRGKGWHPNTVRRILDDG